MSEIEKEESNNNQIAIYRCPCCNAALDSFEARGPYCNIELRDLKSSKVVQGFLNGYNKIINKEMPDFSNYRKKDKEEQLYYFQSQKEELAINYIKNYPVPNSREELIEFMILTISNIDLGLDYDNAINSAWIDKMEQIMKKAEITFKNEQDLKIIKDLYNSKKIGIKQRRYKIGSIIALSLLAYIIVFLIMFLSLLGVALSFLLLSVYTFAFSSLYQKKLVKNISGIPVSIINLLGFALFGISSILFIVFGFITNPFLGVSIVAFVLSIIIFALSIFINKESPIKKILFISSAVIVGCAFLFLILFLTIGSKDQSELIIDGIVNTVTNSK